MSGGGRACEASLAVLLGWLAAGGQEPGRLEGALSALGISPEGAVVYLVPADGPRALAAPDSAMMDQVNLRFAPRVLAVTPGSAVAFRNSDPILHNVFSPPRVGADFDLGTYPRLERRTRVFDRPGAYVILCHVHPEMAAFVVVVPTPWFAVADRQGRYRIEGVPPGRYELRVWHRRLRDPERVVVVAAGSELRVDLELEPAPHARGPRLDDGDRP